MKARLAMTACLAFAGLAANSAMVQTDAAEFWEVRGLHSYLVTPPYTMRLNAQSLALYNPNTGMRRSYGPGSVPANIDVNISASGAGGRDTGSAYTAQAIVYFYFIAGNLGLSGLASLTCPTCSNGSTLGPVLPPLYDTYAFAFPAVVSSQDSLVTDSRQQDEATRCSFVGGISNGSGGAGTTLNVTSVGADCNIPGFHQIRVDNVLRDNGVAMNTRITQLGGGTGLTGTYIVNKSQLIAPGTPMTSTTPYPAGLLVQRDTVTFTNSLLVNLTGAALFGSTFNWVYWLYVPTVTCSPTNLTPCLKANYGAISMKIELDAEISASAAGGTTSGLFTGWQDGTTPCYGNQGSQGIFSTYAYGLNQTYAYNVIWDLPVTCGGFMPMSYVSVGSPNSPPVTVIFIYGYRFAQ